MSDASACCCFALIFARMAKDLEHNRELAHYIYGACQQIDFHPCELAEDDALIVWELAKMVPNPHYGTHPDEPAEIVHYLGIDYAEYPPVYGRAACDLEDADTNEFE